MIGVNKFLTPNSFGINYDADALAYFTRAGITDSTEKNAVNNFVLSCKTNGNIWTALQGGLVYLVSPTSVGASYYNLMSSSYTLTNGVAPAFSTSGWTFNGSTMYLKTGFIPSTEMTLNTGFMAVYSKTNSQSSTFPIASSNTGGTAQWGFTLRNTSNLAIFNAYNASTQTVSNTDSSGTFVFSLSSSTTKYIMRNGTVLASGGTASGSLPAFELYVGARNLNGTASNFSPYNLATVICGKVGLSQSDAQALTTYINTYNSTVISGGR